MDIFKETKAISDQNPDKEIMLRILKLAEESGEMATAVLQLRHYKSRGDKTRLEIELNIREEIVDVLLVAYDLIHIMEISEEEVKARLSKKLIKWQEGVQRYNLKCGRATDKQ